MLSLHKTEKYYMVRLTLIKEKERIKAFLVFLVAIFIILPIGMWVFWWVCWLYASLMMWTLALI